MNIKLYILPLFSTLLILEKWPWKLAKQSHIRWEFYGLMQALTTVLATLRWSVVLVGTFSCCKRLAALADLFLLLIIVDQFLRNLIWFVDLICDFISRIWFLLVVALSLVIAICSANKYRCGSCSWQSYQVSLVMHL